jgi:hypothetical protein
VQAISQIAPQLEVLVLSNCQNISMETARILETSMTNLTVVTLGLQVIIIKSFSKYFLAIFFSIHLIAIFDEILSSNY